MRVFIKRIYFVTLVRHLSFNKIYNVSPTSEEVILFYDGIKDE